MKAKTVWENYKKPTPQKYRMWGDVALLMLLAWQPLVMSSPFDETTKWILDVGVNTLLVGFKFWTNTQKEHTI